MSRRLPTLILLLWAFSARGQEIVSFRPVLAVSGAPAALAAPALVPRSLSASPALAAPPSAPAFLAAPSAVLPSAPSAAVPAALAPAGPLAAAPSAAEAAAPASAPGEAASARAAQAFDGGAAAPIPEITAPRLIITGPPGSGKGTYAARLAKDYGVVHISVGELLRDYAQAHPEIAATMAAGRLVDSGLVLRVVRERLSREDIRARGFILDGFPRRREEAAALAGMLGTSAVDGVIALDVPETELLRRVLARGRADDREDVFRERMRIYREQTVPAVERFKAASPVLAPRVAGSDIAENYARVKAAIGGLLDRLLGRGS